MYSHILVPIDPSHSAVADHMINIARKLLNDDGEITILAVIEPLPNYVSNYLRDEDFRDRVTENRQEALEMIRSRMEASGIRGNAVLEEGTPTREILNTAEKVNADCIILGSHRPEFSDYLIGSTASKVVRHAQCTVVVDRSAPSDG